MLKLNKNCPNCTMHKKCLWHKKSFLGFNLIQIVITVAVLAIIVGTIMYNEDPEKRIGKTKDAQRIMELDTIMKAIENYELEYHTLPPDFNVPSLGIGEKRVICSASAQLTCDGQTNDCVVVDDPNFLGKHLPVLPFDPNKSSATDTGYYVTRSDNNFGLIIGACDAYDPTNTTAIVVNAVLPEYEDFGENSVPTCGNGILEPGEICDYNPEGGVCAENTDYYTTGVVYDPEICTNNPVGCSSICNSCLKYCGKAYEPPEVPCMSPCDSPE